ncbi:hypothetical protein PG993_001258 [Apiospora rasikravindrae]|uniref:Uncharacterized protein n=1 Tax=Apiospora rasikravindrae TaxID=990691 RepID=A0ABR1UCY9_9PEZI
MIRRYMLTRIVDAQEEKIQFLGNVLRQLISDCNEAVIRLNRDLQLLRTNFDSLREDLNSHKSVFDGVLAGLSSLRDAVKENQQPTGDIPNTTALWKQISSAERKLLGTQQEFDGSASSAGQNFAWEMDSVRGELARFQEELHDLKGQIGDRGSLSQENALMGDSFAGETHLLRMEVA